MLRAQRSTYPLFTASCYFRLHGPTFVIVVVQLLGPEQYIPVGKSPPVLVVSAKSSLLVEARDKQEE
jgi:hypothetical protein